MKRLAILLITITTWTILSAQVVDSLSHKQRMIQYINDSIFAEAAKELPLVEDWIFEEYNEKALITINNAMTFARYADSIGLDKSLIDSTYLYTSRQCAFAGKYFYTIKDWDYAENALRWALKIQLNVYGKHHPVYMTFLQDLGDFYITVGGAYFEESKFSVANKYYHKASSTLQYLGDLYCQRGDYLQAEQCYLETYSILKSAFDTQNTDYVTCLQKIVNLYNYVGVGTDGAAEYYVHLYELCPICFDRWRYHRLVDCFFSIKDYAKAEKCLLESPFEDDSGWAERDLASVYLAKKDFAKAEKYCQQALKCFKREPDSALDKYEALTFLGSLYLETGKYSKAKFYLLKAVRTKGCNIDLYTYEYALNTLGELYCKEKKYLKAEPYLKAARDETKNNYIRGVVSCYEGSATTEQQRADYWEDRKYAFEQLYPNFAYYYNYQKPQISTFSYDNELFTKGLLLTSSTFIAHYIKESGDSSLIQKWKQLTALRQQIAEGKKQPSYVLLHKADSLEMFLTLDFQGFLGNQTEDIFKLQQNRAQWEITWDSVRNHLEDNQVAIEYMVAPINKDSTIYCALLVRNNSEYPEMIPLFEEKEVLSLINITSSANTDIMYSYNGNGKTISNLIWGKVLPRIKEGETIYFAPSSLLHEVAIEALPYDSTHTMGEVYNFVRLSSTREIVLKKQEESHATATLYGGIRYNVDAEELLAESEQYSASHLLASRGIENDTLNRGGVRYLPGTKREVEQVNKMLQQSNLQTQLYTSISANEESFKALSGKHQNILHIATHGFYWADSTAQKKDYFSQRMKYIGEDKPIQKTIDPLNRCGLLMAGANIALSGHSADLPEGVQDGILTAKEISLLDLRDANLVVLSACETGKGEITGDGVFGLQRAFKQAGAQTIIMSLWPVNDAVTQLLMTEFYHNWITNNQSKREAFRNAQNTVRSQYPAPSYWAGFIMLD